MDYSPTPSGDGHLPDPPSNSAALDWDLPPTPRMRARALPDVRRRHGRTKRSESPLSTSRKRQVDEAIARIHYPEASDGEYTPECVITRASSNMTILDYARVLDADTPPEEVSALTLRSRLRGTHHHRVAGPPRMVLGQATQHVEPQYALQLPSPCVVVLYATLFGELTRRS